MDRKNLKKKDKPFKVVYEHVDTPDAEERVFKALSMLVKEEDLYS